jgi:hypothetical protein
MVVLDSRREAIHRTAIMRSEITPRLRLSTDTFSKFLPITHVTLCVSLIASWVSQFYLLRPVNELVSWMAADGWCAAEEAINVHCGSDYWASKAASLDANPYINPSVKLPYPPFAIAIFRWFNWLGEQTTQRFAYRFYLLLVLLACLVPVLWFVRRRAENRWMNVFTLGIATVPTIVLLDRANQLAFCIPLLLVFSLAIRDERWFIAQASIVGLTLFKPQYLVLVIVFLPFRKILRGVMTVVASALVLLASFPLFMAQPRTNFDSWRTLLDTFQDGLGSINSFTNVSLVQGLSNLLEIIGRNDWAADVRLHPSHTSLAVILIALLAFGLVGRLIETRILIILAMAIASLNVAVSWPYYLAFAMVGIVILLDDSSNHASVSTQFSLSSRVVSWVLLLALYTSLLPMPILLSDIMNRNVPSYTKFSAPVFYLAAPILWLTLLALVACWSMLVRLRQLVTFVQKRPPSRCG